MKESQRPIEPDDLRRRAEERLKQQPATTSETEAAANDQRLIHELQVHQIELEMQNEELRESRAEAEAGRARYTELYDFAATGYITLRPDSTIVESNLAAARLLGDERAKLTGQRLELFVAESDRQAFKNFLEQVFAKSSQLACEVTLNRPGQPSRIVQVDATLSSNEQECHAVLIDVTEMRRTEAALRESESRLRAIFDTEPECVKLLGPNCALLDMNRAGLVMIEADSLDQVRGRSMLDLVLPEYRPAFADLSDRALRGESGILEFEIHGLHGKHRWLESHVAPYRDASGQITAALGITLDVTQRRRSLNLLEHERSVLEFIAQGAAEMEVLQNLVKSHERLFPGQIASVLLLESGGTKLRHLTAPSLPAEFVQAVDGAEIGPQAGSCGTAAFTGQTAIVADIATSPLWVNWREIPLRHGLRSCWSVPILSSTKEVYGTFAVYGREISEPSVTELAAVESSARMAALAIERRRADRALRESETRFAKIFRVSPEAMVIAELPHGQILDVNDSFISQTGFSRDEAIGRTTLDLNLWVEPRNRESLYSQLSETGSARDLEAVMRIKSGELRIAEFSGVTVELDGRPCAITINRDITEIKQAAALLKEREQQLRLFVEHSPAAIAMLDRNMRYLVYSRRWLADFGLGDQDLVGRSHYEVFPNLPDRWKAIYRTCLAGAVETCEEDSFVRPDGVTEWLRWEVRPWRTADGDIGGLIIFCEVITERIRAQKELRLSEARFRRIVESDLMGMLFWGTAGEVLEANEAFLKIIGYTQEDVRAGRINWRKITPHELWERDELALREIAEIGTCTPFEKEYFRQDGSRVPVLIGGTNFPEQPDRGVAFVLDISARKQAEAALIESERHFRELFEQATDGIIVVDPQLRIVDVNEAACQMIGDTREELDGRHISEFIAPEDHPRIAMEAERVACGGVIHSEWRVQRRNGTEFLGEVSAKQLPDGRIQAFLRDITQRRQSEELIRASEERFATVFRSSPVGVCISTLEDGVFLDVNDAFLKIVGHPREEVIGRSSLDLNYWIDPDDRRKLVEELKEQGSVKNREVQFRRKDCRIGDSLRSLERITLAGEDCILTVLNDVTELKQIEGALLQSEEHYKVLVEGAIEGLIVHQEEIIQFANPSAARIFGFDGAQQMIGLNMLESLIAPDDQTRLAARKAALMDGKSLPNLSGWRAIRKDGTSMRIQSNGSRVIWQGKPAILAFLLDVTEQFQAEEELRLSRERLEILSRQLIATQETERRHLARELHDEIGQALTGIKLNLRKLQPSSPAESVAVLVQDTVEMVNQVVQQVRSLALELRPSMLDDIGLVAALRWCLDRVARQAGLVAHFVADASDGVLPPEIATACFRVVQESLTNIARHANACNVRLSVSHRATELEVVVHDDGCGFDFASARHRATHGGSLGLLSMEERVQLVGGKIEIRSTPDGGTTIHSTFSLDAVSERGDDVVQL